MRYSNWDVLLFPHSSKTPIQEFRTQCFVTRDHDAPFTRDPAFSDVRYMAGGKPLTQVPALTTFVGSLAQSAPFRVSIHSWEQPKASRMLESVARPGDSVTFEARVYIDGALVASSVFNQRTMWPHVIDLCSEIDREGYQEPLRFPPFHQEVLQASSWDAGQLLGRIRVVMAEGFAGHPHSPQAHSKHSFIRVRDVLVFSFQHAPMHILEFSGIAWPNPGMWTQAHARSVPGPALGSQRPFPPEMEQNDDTHAHSPRRPSEPGIVYRSEEAQAQRLGESADHRATQNMQHPPNRRVSAVWGQLRQGEMNVVGPNEALADPFLEPHGLNKTGHRRGLKKSSEDTPMPDVSSYESSRSTSGMTDVGFGHGDGPCDRVASHEAIMSRLVDALSPLKKGFDGLPETATTPSGRRIFSTSIAKGGSRSASRRTTPTRPTNPGGEKQQPAGKERSGDEAGVPVISASPGLLVQSKKEGDDDKENLPETRVPGADFGRQTSLGSGGVDLKAMEKSTTASSDSKRKRPVEETCIRVHAGSAGDSISSSPTKKASKLASTEISVELQSPHTPDGEGMSSGVVVRLATEEGSDT